jgi:hypothetical protein
MRFLMKFFLLFGILAFPRFASTQIAFHKYYSNNGYDFGHGLVQLEDSSYLLCGGSSSFGEGPSQAFLLHLDSVGNYLWSKSYGGEETDVAARVLYIPGDGYLMVGQTNSFGSQAYDALLIKTDLDGNELWHKTYGAFGWERIYDAALTSDSGVIMVGQTYSTIQGDGNLYMVRTNKFGDTLWTKNWGGAREDVLMTIDRFQDSVFFVGGSSEIESLSLTKSLLMRISENGTIAWLDTIGTTGNCGIHGLDVVEADNKVNFVGWQNATSSSQKQSFFGRKFISGQSDFDTYETSSSGEKLYDHIINYGNQGKNYVAMRYYDNSSFQDGYDIAISRLMNGLFWDGYLQSVNYPMEDAIGELIATSDGGAAAVGYSTGVGIGGSNVFLWKIGPNEVFPVIAPNPVVQSLVFLPENDVQSSMKFFPNPGSDVIRLLATDDLKFQVRIVDFHGRMVLQQQVQNQDAIQVSDLENGLYFLELYEAQQPSKLLGRQAWMKH